MKKLFIAMSIVAFGFASCGDASEEASGDEKKAGDAAPGGEAAPGGDVYSVKYL